MNQSKRIVQPYKIVYDKSLQNIKDVYYRIPNTKNIYSIIDIYLWTAYRLTRNSITVIDSSFTVTSNNIPILDNIVIVTKTPIRKNDDYNGIYIGDEWYPMMIGIDIEYLNNYMSKHGAIFNTQEHRFSQYILSTIDKQMKTVIHSKKEDVWIDIRETIYYSWIGTDLMRNNKIVSINGIPIDISIFNLDIQTGHCKNMSKLTSKRSINRVISNANSAKLALVKNINRSCSVSNPRELALKVQIPEIIL